MRVCAHVFISIHLSMCVRVCMCIYVYIHGEEDRCSVVKEKPFVTYPHGHIKSFTQLFLNWHSFEMASFCVIQSAKVGALLTYRTYQLNFWKMDSLYLYIFARI